MIGLQTGFYWFEVGSKDFLFSFFSTIAYRLEDSFFGSRYPIIMKEFYKGKISFHNLEEGINELKKIKEELVLLSPDKVIWDIENLENRPPWGDEISNEITNLSNYFITCNGEDLFDVIFEAFQIGLDIENDVLIKSL